MDNKEQNEAASCAGCIYLYDDRGTKRCARYSYARLDDVKETKCDGIVEEEQD